MLQCGSIITMVIATITSPQKRVLRDSNLLNEDKKESIFTETTTTKGRETEREKAFVYLYAKCTKYIVQLI